jgi:glutamate dehydrogenase
MGPIFVRMTAEKTGATIADITNAFMVVRNAFGLQNLWSSIEMLDNRIAASVQLRALYKTSCLAERETYWLLTRLGRDVIADKDSEKFAKSIGDLKKKLESILPQDIVDNLKLRRKSWVEDGMPQNLANEISLLPLLGSGFDIIKISDQLKSDTLKVAQIYFAAGSTFHLEKLRNKAMSIPQDKPNMGAAVSGLVDSLYSVQADLSSRIMRDMGKSTISEKTISQWIEKFCPRASSVLDTVAAMERAGSGDDLAGLVVVEQQLRQLV